ncbi:MAG: hypothetical protein AB1405_07360 [Bdellovibrionota bacterium]
MGFLLMVGALLGVAASQPPLESFMERTAIFDVLEVPGVESGPWKLVSWVEGKWMEVPADAQGGTAYLRARFLGDVGHSPPPGARFRVRARTEDGRFDGEGFLVPGGEMPPSFQLSEESFSSEKFSLEFPGGTGFYENLRGPTGILLARAVRLRLRARILGAFPIERTSADFRWISEKSSAGAAVAERRFLASVRALFRYVTPRPQRQLFTADTLTQEVEVAVPPGLLSFGGHVTLENGFSLPDESEALLSGSSGFRKIETISTGASYEWMAVKNAGGVFLHWLSFPPEAKALAPAFYSFRADGTLEAGYRMENIEEVWEKASAGKGFVPLTQRFAVLGGAELSQELSKPSAARALSEALAVPPSRWVVSVEEIL